MCACTGVSTSQHCRVWEISSLSLPYVCYTQGDGSCPSSQICHLSCFSHTDLGSPLHLSLPPQLPPPHKPSCLTDWVYSSLASRRPHLPGCPAHLVHRSIVNPPSPGTSALSHAVPSAPGSCGKLELGVSQMSVSP